jgi:hypothetical protein
LYTGIPMLTNFMITQILKILTVKILFVYNVHFCVNNIEFNGISS